MLQNVIYSSIMQRNLSQNTQAKKRKEYNINQKNQY